MRTQARAWMGEIMHRHILVALCAAVLFVGRASAQDTTLVAPPAAPAAPSAPVAPSAPPKAPAGRGDIEGAVTDSSNGQPLQGIAVAVTQEGRFVSGSYTDAFGRFTIHNLQPGTYTVTARTIGYRARAQTGTLEPGKASVRVNFALASAPLMLSKVDVVGSTAPSLVDLRTGNQQFQVDQSHAAPTTTTSQILQQSITGAVRAPTGEVHIRGQHAEYTYYVDGVPVPSGVSGSLNELFDPSIINHIGFVTGGWDAEYGNKNTAIVDVVTRIPTGGYHAEVAGFGGSFDTNGQQVSVSSNSGKVGLFATGSRQETKMRLEPVLFDPATDKPINFHNHGQDLSGFGKIQLNPSTGNILDLDMDWSQTHFDVPYDSTGGIALDDRQKDANGFVNLGFRHRSEEGEGGGATRELFGAAFYRVGRLKYLPGPNDDPTFVFFPDTTLYNLRENRSFHTLGLKADYSYRPRHSLEIKSGALASTTSGHEDFETLDINGSPGPASNGALKGHDVGLYAQTAISPSDRVEVRAGVRYDAHQAPFAGTTTQVSPRIRFNLFPNAGNSLWLYYGRLFVPTNIEDLRAITSVADSGVATRPTLPERDHFFEAGYLHRFPVGVVTKLAVYHKRSSPGIDDNTVPGSSIVTSVNIDQVRITGIEATLEAKPSGPISGFANVALNHAYGLGPITGGFFPADTPEGFFDLDHDQRLSMVSGITYAPGQFYVSGTGIYGSGLTNGADPDASYGNGLFDFNNSIHVDPNFILNASAGYAFNAGGTLIRPQIFVENVFDNHYLLKGAFFSGASVGRPRSVQVRLSVGL
jgi:hypothetical protein